MLHNNCEEKELLDLDMRKFGFLLTALAGILALNVKAQYDPSFAHYWMMEPEFNPAAVGVRPTLRAIGAYSNQLSGYQNNPKTMYVSADMPFTFIRGNHHAGGVYLQNDEIGFFSHKRVAIQYAFRFGLFGGTMSIGLQGEVLNESFDGSKIDVEDTSDPAIPSSSVNGNKLDAGAGLYWNNDKLYVGVSSQHITAPTVTMGEKYLVDIKRSYYFTAGYNIALRNPLFSIHPTVRWMYDGQEDKGDITVRAQYEYNEKMLFIGASYSPSTSATLLVGGKFHGVVISYSYEAYTGGVGLGNGAHELVVSYLINLNVEKKGKNRHQSVRLL